MIIHYTGNASTVEYFITKSIGTLNAYIDIFDINGFVESKILPLKEYYKWVKQGAFEV